MRNRDLRNAQEVRFSASCQDQSSSGLKAAQRGRMRTDRPAPQGAGRHRLRLRQSRPVCRLQLANVFVVIFAVRIGVPVRADQHQIAHIDDEAEALSEG